MPRTKQSARHLLAHTTTTRIANVLAVFGADGIHGGGVRFPGIGHMPQPKLAIAFRYSRTLVAYCH
jgi:hypothetical protein